MRVDQQVIEACKLRDEKAQRQVYEKFAPSMLGVCLRYTKTRVEAEDILQEGFLTVFTKIDQFSDKGSFEGWIRRIMVNTALMHFRKTNAIQNAQVNEDISNLADEADSESSENGNQGTSAKDQILNADFNAGELMAVIQELPDGFRMVFNLTILEGYKHREAAEMLGISESTSKTQLLRARKLIQKKLLEKAGEKKKGNKTAIIALLALSVKDDLNYIDELFRQELGNLDVTPGAGWNALSEKLNGPAAPAPDALPHADLSSALQSGSGLVSSAGGKILSFIGNHIQAVIIGSIATITSLTLLLTSVNHEPASDLPQNNANSEMILPADSTMNQSDSGEESNLPTQLEQTKPEATPQSETHSSASSQSSIMDADTTVYDTVQVVKHKQVIIPKQIRKTVEQKKIIHQQVDNQP